MAVSNFLVAVSYASWAALPYLFPSIPSYLQAVAVAPSFSFVAHEPEECHVNRSHTKLEGFKMETEVLTKTVEDLPESDTDNCKLIWIMS